MQRFDVIVVGARCAGAPLAAMPARRGHSVCLLDRAQFPSETPSTHIIQPCSVEMLERFGVLDAVLAAGTARVEGVTLVNDDIRIDTAGEEVTRQYADVRTGTRVMGLLRENGRVAGVETMTGPIAARLVVGADGRHSTVASAVGAAEYHVSAPRRMPAWAYFEGVPDHHGRALLGRMGDLAYLSDRW